MTVLILDSSGPYAVLAVADGEGNVLSTLAFESSRTLSTRLFSQVDAVLSAAGLNKGAIEALAVGIGPGSFTGLRIAVTTFRTMAQVLRVPLVGIPALAAYAEPLLALSYQLPLVVLMPSRRNEFYLSVYSSGDPVVAPLAESTDDARKRVADLAEGGRPVVLCGRTESLGSLPGTLVVQQRWPSPDSLARIAVGRLSTASDETLTLLPDYIVPPTITTPREASTAQRGRKSSK